MIRAPALCHGAPACDQARAPVSPRVDDWSRPVDVERRGEPHVVVISVDEYEGLTTARQGQPDWRELVSQSRAQVRADLGDRQLEPPEEVLAEIREERDEQLASLH